MSQHERFYRAPDDDGGDGAGDDASTTTTTPPPPPPATGDDATPALDRARREAAEQRRLRREAEEERDRLKASQMSEHEKATKRAEDAEKREAAAVERLRVTSLRAEVGLVAPGLGIVNAKAALRLIDESDVEYGDDGDATSASVTKALKAAVKEYPFLTRSGSADAGDGGERERTGAPRPGEDAFGRDLNAALRRGR